jgi:thiamine biosynthesis lipoprotein
MPGMMLDVGGIAKGYAADLVRDYFIEEEIQGAIINLGGNIQTVGRKPDGEPWRIGIQDPGSPRGDYVLIVEFLDGAIVTSGTYERYFQVDGKRYHHILNTETGYPVENSIESVSILTGDSFIADALSTAVFSMGLEAGMEFVESYPGTEAVFIDSQKMVHLSSGLHVGGGKESPESGEETSEKPYTIILNNPDYTISSDPL